MLKKASNSDLTITDLHTKTNYTQNFMKTQSKTNIDKANLCQAAAQSSSSSAAQAAAQAADAKSQDSQRFWDIRPPNIHQNSPTTWSRQ